MRVEIISVFPHIFDSFLTTSLIATAISNKLIDIQTISLRDFADAPHFRVDDEPYGGGPGMVLKPEPLARAIRDCKSRLPDAKVILLTPAGKVFNQALAQEASLNDSFILVCGRYEGIDERIIETYVDEQWSIGDYVLMGGEVPAMAVIEAIVRLRPGVLGNQASLQQESFCTLTQPQLEAPQYTRPVEFEDMPVPSVLRSGNHNDIKKWRSDAARKKTARLRPDLLPTKTEDY